MLGVSRTVKAGKTTLTEYMQVVEEEWHPGDDGSTAPRRQD